MFCRCSGAFDSSWSIKLYLLNYLATCSIAWMNSIEIKTESEHSFLHSFSCCLYVHCCRVSTDCLKSLVVCMTSKPSSVNDVKHSGYVLYSDILQPLGRLIPPLPLRDGTTTPPSLPDSVWFFLFINAFDVNLGFEHVYTPPPEHLSIDSIPSQFQIPINIPSALHYGVVHVDSADRTCSGRRGDRN